MTPIELFTAMHDLTQVKVGTSRGFIVSMQLRYERAVLVAHDIAAIVEDGSGRSENRTDVHPSEFRALTAAEHEDAGKSWQPHPMVMPQSADEEGAVRGHHHEPNRPEPESEGRVSHNAPEIDEAERARLNEIFEEFRRDHPYMSPHEDERPGVGTPERLRRYYASRGHDVNVDLVGKVFRVTPRISSQLNVSVRKVKS